MSWIYLVSAGLLGLLHEAVGWFYSADSHINYYHCDDRQLGLPAMAMRTLPLSTAYTVWTGIGIMKLS